MISSISAGIPSIFIFLLVGVLISILSHWNYSNFNGIRLPTCISKNFRSNCFVVCAIVGTSIGSAFTTAATVGLAFMGMGTALDTIQPYCWGNYFWAFFGDKMSPLSDTTNLAPAVTV